MKRRAITSRNTTISVGVHPAGVPAGMPQTENSRIWTIDVRLPWMKRRWFLIAIGVLLLGTGILLLGWCTIVWHYNSAAPPLTALARASAVENHGLIIRISRLRREGANLNLVVELQWSRNEGKGRYIFRRSFQGLQVHYWDTSLNPLKGQLAYMLRIPDSFSFWWPKSSSSIQLPGLEGDPPRDNLFQSTISIELPPEAKYISVDIGDGISTKRVVIPDNEAE
jgi:hypothetical protein